MVRVPQKPSDSRILGRRGVILLTRGLDLVRRFGEMNDHRDAQPIGERAAGLQRRRIERVHRVRRHGRLDQLVVGEFRRELLRPGQTFGRRLRVRHGELDDRLAEHAPEAGRLGDAGNLLLEVVHVRRTWWCPTRSSRAPPVASRRERTPERRSSLLPERCISAANPSTRDRRPNRGRGPSAHGCGC